jgi:hypothetical protein
LGASKIVFGREIEEVTEGDLQSLRASGVAEKKILDFKKQLPFGYDNASKKTEWHEKAKMEFAKDVSSFANASGGLLVFGIDDRGTGIAKNIVGLAITNEDCEKIENAMDGVLRAQIKPPIANMRYRMVPVTGSSSGGAVYVLEIPKSWRAPHGVASNGGRSGYTFWARSDAKGKYPLDVGELQEAFNLSQTIIDRIRRFREDRIAKITAGETPAPLHDGPKVILHLVPLSSFDPAKRCNLTKVVEGYSNLQPFSLASGQGIDYNLDGLVSVTPFEKSASGSLAAAAYVQLFRNGIIESVDSESYISPLARGAPPQPGVDNFLRILLFEHGLIEAVERYLRILDNLQVDTPAYLFLTLTDVDGVILLTSNIMENLSIDRNIAHIPEVCIPNYDEKEAYRYLEDVINSVWNAWGVPQSPSYQPDGTFLNDARGEIRRPKPS